VYPIHVIPVLGLFLLTYPENYHVVLINNNEQAAIGIDIKQDLPIHDLRVVNQAGDVVVLRESTRREVARFTSRNGNP
jgi:hypothetical protein